MVVVMVPPLIVCRRPYPSAVISAVDDAIVFLISRPPWTNITRVMVVMVRGFFLMMVGSVVLWVKCLLWVKAVLLVKGLLWVKGLRAFCG